MAEVAVPMPLTPALAAPTVCVRTGRPAVGRLKVPLRYYEPWVYALFVLGVVGAIVAALVARKATIEVPVAAGVRRRRLVAQACGIVGGVTVCVALAWVSAAPGPASAAGLVATMALVGFAVYAHLAWWVGPRWVGGHTVRLRRADPEYVAQVDEAVRRMTAPPPVPAGWYADPGGTPAWRWWDGGRWTDHLSGPGPAPAGPAW